MDIQELGLQILLELIKQNPQTDAQDLAKKAKASAETLQGLPHQAPPAGSCGKG